VADNGVENSLIVKRTPTIIIVSVGQHMQGGCDGSKSGGNDCGKATITILSRQDIHTVLHL
jgi:hypothetical protein